MPRNDVEIRLGLKGKLAEAYRRVSTTIERRNAQIKASAERARAAVNRFAGGVQGLVAAVGGLLIFRQVNRLIGESIRLFDTQITAQVQLETSLGYTSQALLDQASALQRVTRYGDEATIQGMALIAAFVKEEEQIAKVMPLVQDLATAKKMQLSVAADLVSKTLGSSTNALARYGIQVEGAVGSTERLEDLTTALEGAFGGSARAAAEAGAGPLVQLQNRIGDIKELLGKAFLPLVTKTAKELETMLTGGIEDTEELEKRFRKFAGVAAIIIGSFQDTYNVIMGTFKMAAGVINSTIGYVFKGIEKMLTGVSWLIEQWNKIRDFFGQEKYDTSGLDAAIHKMKDLGQAGVESGRELADEGVRMWENTGKAILAWEELNDAIEKTKETAAKPTPPPTPGKGEGEKLKEDTDALLDYLEAQEEAGDKIENIADAAKKAMEARRATIKQFASNLQEAFGASKKWSVAQKLVAASEATYSTYLSAQKMFEAGTKFPFPLNTVMPWVLSASAIAAGLARVSQIKSAARGIDYVTSGPEYIRVGDNPSGRERVRVDPLGASETASGSNMINISGGINIYGMSNADEIADTIQERLRGFVNMKNEAEALAVA